MVTAPSFAWKQRHQKEYSHVVLAVFAALCTVPAISVDLSTVNLVGCYDSDRLLFGEDNSILSGEGFDFLSWTPSSCSRSCYARGLPFSALQHLSGSVARCLCGHDVSIRAVRRGAEACGPCVLQQPSSLCLQTLDVYLRKPDLPDKVTFAKDSFGTLRCYKRTPTSGRFRYWWAHNNSLMLQRSADIIFVAHPHKSGVYKCAVEYEIDPFLAIWTAPLVKSNASEVIIEQPPVVFTTPQVSHIFSGGVETFNCDANGTYPLQFSWLRRLDHEPHDHHFVDRLRWLVVKDVTSRDEGLYTCVAHNRRLNISAVSPAQLIVYDPPEISISNADIVATRGSRVTLSCRVHLDPDTMPAAISWQKRVHLDADKSLICDSNLVKGLSKFNLQRSVGDFSSQESNRTLQNVSVDHAGTWSCAVSSTRLLGCHWPFVNNQLRLHIWEPPDVSISPNDSLVLVHGRGGVNLTCHVDVQPALQNQPLIITWYKNGKDILANVSRTNNFILNERGKRLLLTTPLPEQSGRYQCSAMFEQVKLSRYVAVNLLLSESVAIMVQDPPKAKCSPQSLTVPIHSDVMSRCTADGGGSIRTKWQRHFGSMVLDIPGTNSSGRESVLRLQNINARDEGVYLCLAINSAIVDAEFQTSTATFMLSLVMTTEASSGITTDSTIPTLITKEQSSGSESAVIIGAVFGLVSTLIVVIVLLVLLKNKPKHKRQPEEAGQIQEPTQRSFPINEALMMPRSRPPFHPRKAGIHRSESDSTYVGFFHKSGQPLSRLPEPRQMKKNRRLQAEVAQRLPASLLSPRTDMQSFDTITWSSVDTADQLQSYAYLAETPHCDPGREYSQDEGAIAYSSSCLTTKSSFDRLDSKDCLFKPPFSAPGYDDVLTKKLQATPRWPAGYNFHNGRQEGIHNGRQEGIHNGRQEGIHPMKSLSEDRLRLSSVNEEGGRIMNDAELACQPQDECRVAPPAWLQEDLELESPLRSNQGKWTGMKQPAEGVVEESNEYSIPYTSQQCSADNNSPNSRLSILGRRLSRLLYDAGELVSRLGSTSRQSSKDGGLKMDESARYSYPRSHGVRASHPPISKADNQRSRYSCQPQILEAAAYPINNSMLQAEKPAALLPAKQPITSHPPLGNASLHQSSGGQGYTIPLHGTESAPPACARPMLNRKFEFTGAARDTGSLRSEEIEQPYSSYQMKTLRKTTSCQSLPVLRRINRRGHRTTRSLRSRSSPKIRRRRRDDCLSASNEEIRRRGNCSVEGVIKPAYSPGSIATNERTRQLMAAALARQRTLSPVQIRDGRPRLRRASSNSPDSSDECFGDDDDDLDSYDHLDFRTTTGSSLRRQDLATPDEVGGSAIYTRLSMQRYRNIPEENIHVMDEIGAGRFGYVYRAEWVEGRDRLEVAIKVMKTLQDGQCRADFLKEAAIMGRFRHANIVRLFGVVAGSMTMLVCELMVGNLREYLHTIKPQASISLTIDLLQHLLRICEEIASGMEYLARHGYVHRDLAARNVMLDENGTCKIGDFGMSRVTSESEYYVSSGGVIPVKWTAPEAIEYRQFSSASDVWSYGVVLYEVWSFGEKPYSNWTNEKVLKEVSDGYRLPQPVHCPSSIDALMRSCWATDYCNRPSFTAILQSLFATNEVLQFLVIEEDADYTDICPSQET